MAPPREAAAWRLPTDRCPVDLTALPPPRPPPTPHAAARPFLKLCAYRYKGAKGWNPIRQCLNNPMDFNGAPENGRASMKGVPQAEYTTWECNGEPNQQWAADVVLPEVRQAPSACFRSLPTSPPSPLPPSPFLLPPSPFPLPPSPFPLLPLPRPLVFSAHSIPPPPLSLSLFFPSPCPSPRLLCPFPPSSTARRAEPRGARCCAAAPSAASRAPPHPQRCTRHGSPALPWLTPSPPRSALAASLRPRRPDHHALEMADGHMR